MHDEESRKHNSRLEVDGRDLSTIAYIPFVGWLIALLLNHPRSGQIAFHLRRSLGIFLILSLRVIVPFMFWPITAACTVLWILGLINTLNGKDEPVPVLGPYFDKWLRRL